MTDIIKAIVLGIVQGLTEFLPVSSSGHLEIFNHFMGTGEAIDSDLTMVIITHFGTALSIIYVFRKDIGEIILSLLRFKTDEHFQLSMKIVLSMLPALFIGLLFEKEIEAIFANDTLLFVGIFLCITAVVLWFTPKTELKLPISFPKAFGIGIAQAIAILPGISRSGMTISAALYMGIDRAKAARFSFLMVLPVIIGKVILDIASGEMTLSGSNGGPILAALVTSFVVGIWACKWMLTIVQKSQLSYFALYCLIIGLLSMVSAFI